MFLNNILDEFIIIRLIFFHSKIVEIKYPSLMHIFRLYTLSKSSFFVDIASYTRELLRRMLQLLRFFSFFCNSQIHPKTLQMVLQISFNFLACKYVLNLQPNYYVKDIELQYFDLSFVNRSK
jgi:hypothetical protein